MMRPATFQLVAAGLHLAPALLWGVIAKDVFDFLRKRNPRNAFARVLLVLAAIEALQYVAWTAMILLRPGDPWRGALLATVDASGIVLVAIALHLLQLWPFRGQPPGPTWAAVNYGLAAIAIGRITLRDLGIAPMAGSALPWTAVYVLLAGAAAAVELGRQARRRSATLSSGGWRPGRLPYPRSLDLAVVATGICCDLASHLVPAFHGTNKVAMILGGEPTAAALAMLALEGAAGVLYALPIVVRNLGDLLPTLATLGVMLLAVGTTWVGGLAAEARIADPEVRHALEIALVLLVVLVLMPLRPWVQATIGRLAFRRGRLGWDMLYRTLQTLSPDLGPVECCRRALGELVRVMRVRGAAILLRDGRLVVEGDFRPGRLAAVWPSDHPAIPDRAFSGLAFWSLPPALTEALAEADVLAVVPLSSPQGRRGHIFITTDLRGASFSDDDDAAVEGLAGQLALVLDAAELLERALAVERSLAHAEKLAAIGETAARIAHDIRNPVTAARSLAQQLAREPGTAFARELAIILEELERVERQVATLLRFARREEFNLVPVELGALARGAVDALRPRLAAAGVEAVLEVTASVTARADAEKIRQVVVNLLENAADAMAEHGGGRVAVGVHNGSGGASLVVTDDGPGVPPEALPRLFEPFFSLKPHGTGLGLAIARRTVEAHGGRIEASCPAEGGLAVRIELPRVEGEGT
jgi:signal transduction histidine kinase